VIADDAEPAVVLQRALTRQRDAALAHPVPSLEERLLDLRALRRFVCENRQAICDAISADYGYRSPRETRLAEIAPTLEDLDHVLGHLTAWLESDPDGRAVGCPGRAVFGRRRAIVAAVGHAVEFETWRSLVRRQGLPRVEAVAAMVTLIETVSRPARS